MRPVKRCYCPPITAQLAVDASLAWLVGAALVSGVLAYFGAMVGLVLGQFRLPLLIAALGSAPAAAASNLAISSLGAATGALAHAREGRVEVRLLLTIGAPSMVAAYLSSSMVPHFDAWWVEALIGVTLLVSAVPLGLKARELRDGPPSVPAKLEATDAPEPALESEPSPGPGPRPRVVLRPGLVAIEVVVGAVLGALSGVVGLLLGTLRLPAMLRLGVSPAEAAGTNMMIGFLTGVAGAVGAVGGGRVSWTAFGLVGGATVIAAWLGARRTKSLPSARHFALIAIVLVGVGVWLIGSAFAGRA